MINQIYKGDCLEIMKDIKDNSIDFICCDLPYGTTACAWDSILPFDLMWLHYERIIKPNGVIALFADEPFTSKLICSNLPIFRYRLTWDKMVGGSPLNSHKMPLKQTEDICIFSLSSLGNHTYNPQLGKKHRADIRPIGNRKEVKASTYGKTNGGYSESYVKEKKHPTTLVSVHAKEAECNSVNRIHPTQKPLALMTNLIRTYSNEGDIVLDNCMGSGSTIVAAIREKRNYIGIEKDDKIFEVANKRISHELSQIKLF